MDIRRKLENHYKRWNISFDQDEQFRLLTADCSKRQTSPRFNGVRLCARCAHDFFSVRKRGVMPTRARGLRLPEELQKEIEREMALRGATFSEVASSLLREAVRMRRVPGVVFVDGPVGRRASIAGTGLDVWEVVATFKTAGEDRERLKASYEWLSDRQLSAALAYYGLYPKEIDARIEEEEYWTPEKLYGEFPYLRPRVAPSSDALET